METWRKARIFKDAELKGTVKSKERRGKKIIMTLKLLTRKQQTETKKFKREAKLCRYRKKES